MAAAIAGRWAECTSADAAATASRLLCRSIRRWAYTLTAAEWYRSLMCWLPGQTNRRGYCVAPWRIHPHSTELSARGTRHDEPVIVYVQRADRNATGRRRDAERRACVAALQLHQRRHGAKAHIGRPVCVSCVWFWHLFSVQSVGWHKPPQALRGCAAEIVKILLKSSILIQVTAIAELNFEGSRSKTGLFV